MARDRATGRDPHESTASLLVRIRGGDERARERLLRRYLPILTAWAHGRLSGTARDLEETDDLVQSTLLNAVRHLQRFEARREGAFIAYLRQSYINAVRSAIRAAGRRPHRKPLSDDVHAGTPSPLQHAISAETFERYEQALNKLSERTREAVILRIEFGMSFQEIATMTDGPSEDAARMMVKRGLSQLREHMHHDAP